jgi:hypothetical protein
MTLDRKKKDPIKKKFSPCNMVIFFDFDEVLHISEVSEEKEAVSPKPVDLVLIKKITQLAMKCNCPLIIVTARADNDVNRSLITQFITLVGGFHLNVGGFHLEDIYYLGVESIQQKSRKKSLIAIRQPKIKIIQKIHLEKFPTLSNKQIFFIDDEEKNILPVEKAGYSVIRAVSGSNKHLEDVHEVIQKNMQQVYLLTCSKVHTDILFKPKRKKRQDPLPLSMKLTYR